MGKNEKKSFFSIFYEKTFMSLKNRLFKFNHIGIFFEIWKMADILSILYSWTIQIIFESMSLKIWLYNDVVLCNMGKMSLVFGVSKNILKSLVLPFFSKIFAVKRKKSKNVKKA